MHRRPLIAGITAVAILCPTVPTLSVAVRSAHHRLAAVQPETDTGCGVERWSVKTGMDPDARLVDQRMATPTNISTLRGLPAPAQPPLNARVKPVETTVWSLDALLVRYKVEADSDYHLVLSDTGGRTMIAEIPSPCKSLSVNESALLHYTCKKFLQQVGEHRAMLYPARAVGHYEGDGA